MEGIDTRSAAPTEMLEDRSLNSLLGTRSPHGHPHRFASVSIWTLFFKIGEVILVILRGVLLEDFLPDDFEPPLIGLGLRLARSSCCATASR
jgi:hypothetical protein